MSNVLAFRQKHVETPEATGKGFALIHRQFMDSRLYKDSQAVHLWFHFIMRASHKASLVETHLGKISIGRGQFITGRPTLVDETGILDRRIRTLMEKFERMGMISSEPFGRSFSRITVLKYDEYQPENRPIKSQETANENPQPARLAEDIEPTKSQRKAKDNKLNTKSLSNDNDMSSDDDKSSVSKSKPIPYQAVLDAYNEAAGDRLPNAEKLNAKRRTDIKRLLGELKEPTVEAASNYFHAFMSAAGTFYFGDNSRGWRASLDYLLRSDTLTKTREGSL